MSRDPGYKFEKKNYFSPNSIKKFKETLPNLGESGSITKRYSQKTKLGVENNTSPPPTPRCL